MNKKVGLGRWLTLLPWRPPPAGYCWPEPGWSFSSQWGGDHMDKYDYDGVIVMCSKIDDHNLESIGGMLFTCCMLFVTVSRESREFAPRIPFPEIRLYSLIKRASLWIFSRGDFPRKGRKSIFISTRITSMVSMHERRCCRASCRDGDLEIKIYHRCRDPAPKLPTIGPRCWQLGRCSRIHKRGRNIEALSS